MGKMLEAKVKALPGRPRDLRLDELILTEAVRELSINGLRHFSILSIARRAKIAKATVYLRWPDRNRLILEALKTTGQTLHKPNTGSLKGDLRELVHQWTQIFNDEQIANVISRVSGERAEFTPLVKSYREQIAVPANKMVEDVLRNGIKQGWIRRDVNTTVAARSIVGALQLQGAFSRSKITPQFERDLVEMMYAALSAGE